MPKSTIQFTVDGKRQSRKFTVKHNVGSRKNAKSAHGLSTETLIAMLIDKTKPRATSKILRVLKLRGMNMIDLTSQVLSAQVAKKMAEITPNG